MPVVVVPGIMGSCLLRPDGTPVWLNLRNALGHYNLRLPFTLPLSCEGRTLAFRGRYTGQAEFKWFTYMQTLIPEPSLTGLAS